jgi:ribosome recycling factor
MEKGVVDDYKKSVDKTVNAYKKYLSTVKTGRAHTALFENIMVESYGQTMPLKQLASISTPDASTVVIQPWDASTLKEIEKTILKANMGFTPQNDGKTVKINIPTMTEEDRKQVVKLLKKESEKYKVTIRNSRKKANKTVKDMEKDKIISEDESKKLEKDIQKTLDDGTKKIDELTKAKEKEITSI